MAPQRPLSPDSDTEDRISLMYEKSKERERARSRLDAMKPPCDAKYMPKMPLLPNAILAPFDTVNGAPTALKAMVSSSSVMISSAEGYKKPSTLPSSVPLRSEGPESCSRSPTLSSDHHHSYKPDNQPYRYAYKEDYHDHSEQFRYGARSLVPELAQDLRRYWSLVQSARIHFTHRDGKVNPSHYGSTLEYDLGLCYSTFMSKYMCEHGQMCPWRHHPLTKEEEVWIENLQAQNIFFLRTVRKSAFKPEVPPPTFALSDWMVKENIVAGIGEMVERGVERRGRDRSRSQSRRREDALGRLGRRSEKSDYNRRGKRAGQIHRDRDLARERGRSEDSMDRDPRRLSRSLSASPKREEYGDDKKMARAIERARLIESLSASGRANRSRSPTPKRPRRF